MADDEEPRQAPYGEAWAAIYDDEARSSAAGRSTSIAARPGRERAGARTRGRHRTDSPLPLIEGGIEVDGIDTSATMVEKLHANARSARTSRSAT